MAAVVFDAFMSIFANVYIAVLVLSGRTTQMSLTVRSFSWFLLEHSFLLFMVL